MPFQCPMCGGRGRRNREHVFGQWLTELFGLQRERVATFATGVGPLHASRGLGVVVKICAACNGGWMADLERAFATVATDPILGRAVVLDGPALRTIAHWAAKTALMLQDHLEGLGNLTHRARGHVAAIAGGPPPGTVVWLGAYAPRTRFVFWQGVPMTVPGVDGTPTDESVGYATLMTVGHLVMVVLAMDADHSDTTVAEGLHPLAFRQAWPLGDQTHAWPDGLVLNDRGIAAFWPPHTLHAVTKTD